MSNAKSGSRKKKTKLAKPLRANRERLFLHDGLAHAFGQTAKSSAAIFFVDHDLEDAGGITFFPSSVERLVEFGFGVDKVAFAAAEQFGQPMVLPKRNVVKI